MTKKIYCSPRLQSIEFGCKDGVMGLGLNTSETRPGSGALSNKKDIPQSDDHTIWKEQ